MAAFLTALSIILNDAGLPFYHEGVSKFSFVPSCLQHLSLFQQIAAEKMEKPAGAVPTITAVVAFKKFKCQGGASPIKFSMRNQVCTALMNRRPRRTGGVSGMLGAWERKKEVLSFSKLRSSLGWGVVRNPSNAMSLPPPESDIDDLPQALPSSPPPTKTACAAMSPGTYRCRGFQDRKMEIAGS